MPANMADTVALFQTSTDLVRSSAALAHEFVKGDKTVDVVGSNGTYPSLAKIADSAQQVLDSLNVNSQNAVTTLVSNGKTAIDTIVAECRLALDNNSASLRLSQDAIAAVLHLAQGVIGKTYTFAATTQLIVKHNMGSVNFTKSITNANGDDVFAPVTIIDVNEFHVNFTSPEAGTLNVMFYLNC